MQAGAWRSGTGNAQVSQKRRNCWYEIRAIMAFVDELAVARGREPTNPQDLVQTGQEIDAALRTSAPAGQRAFGVGSMGKVQYESKLRKILGLPDK